MGMGGKNWTVSPRELGAMKKFSWKNPGLEFGQASGKRLDEIFPCIQLLILSEVANAWNS